MTSTGPSVSCTVDVGPVYCFISFNNLTDPLKPEPEFSRLCLDYGTLKPWEIENYPAEPAPGEKNCDTIADETAEKIMCLCAVDNCNVDFKDLTSHN
jgi:hypothetical protein